MPLATVTWWVTTQMALLATVKQQPVQAVLRAKAWRSSAVEHLATWWRML